MAKDSTHIFVDIKEIRGSTVVLKTGNLRSVLMVSSINFELKSEEEQKALIARFQELLNSLDFTLQIVVQSRPLDLSEYFTFLNEQQDKQENELLRIQTTEYLDFIKEMVTLANIMSKFFYVIVPHDIAAIKRGGGILEKFENILPGQGSNNSEEKEQIRFEDAESELSLRVSHITALLGSMGLRAIQLENKDIVELFYGLYNPGVTLKQKNFETLLATGRKEKKTEE